MAFVLQIAFLQLFAIVKFSVPTAYWSVHSKQIFQPGTTSEHLLDLQNKKQKKWPDHAKSATTHPHRPRKLTHTTLSASE